ncbi:unnamed protein product, partial [Iphiclides podalirius]
MLTPDHQCATSAGQCVRIIKSACARSWLSSAKHLPLRVEVAVVPEVASSGDNLFSICVCFQEGLMQAAGRNLLQHDSHIVLNPPKWDEECDVIRPRVG